MRLQGLRFVQTNTHTGASETEAESEIVWEDVRHSTSQTFYSAYADGVGLLYVVTTEGQSWSYRDGLWSNIPLDVDEEDINGLWGSGTGAGMKMVGVGNGGTIIDWNGVEGAWNVTEDGGTANFSTSRNTAGRGGGVLFQSWICCMLMAMTCAFCAVADTNSH